MEANEGRENLQVLPNQPPPPQPEMVDQGPGAVEDVTGKHLRELGKWDNKCFASVETNYSSNFFYGAGVSLNP